MLTTSKSLLAKQKINPNLKPNVGPRFKSEGVSQKSYVPVVLSFCFFSHSVSPATQCFAPQAATATVDATLKANKLTSANANNDFMNKAPFRQANRTRQLLSCTGRGR